jgi:hypothetical protein
MLHRLTRGKVTVGTWSDYLTVGDESAFQNNDRMGRRVPMGPSLQPGWVSNQVVLGSRPRVLVEKAQTYRLVVDDGLRPGETHRTGTRDDDRPMLFHHVHLFTVGGRELTASDGDPTAHL